MSLAGVQTMEVQILHNSHGLSSPVAGPFELNIPNWDVSVARAVHIFFRFLYSTLSHP